MVESEASKYAHFEKVDPSSLPGIYERHAEVARDIHQDVLRQFTGNNGLTVDLVRENPLAPKSTETLDKLEEYDVVSVSSIVGLWGVVLNTGIAGHDLIREYKRRFTEEDMPV